MNAQRILCYLHSFEPGGVERTALNLCRVWQDQGADVTLVMGRASGRATTGACDLPYRWLPNPGFSTATFETLWMILFLPLIVIRSRPDVIFCAGNSYTVVAVMLKLLLGRRCPPIVAKISNDLDRADLVQPIRWIYHAWCRVQGRAIDHLVALSADMAEHVRSVTRISAERIAVLPDAVLDDERISALALAGRAARDTRGDSRRFVAIGRLTTQKNFAGLIAAFARGARGTDRLTIVGEGKDRKRLERQISRFGLNGRVTLTGHSPHVTDWLARSDAMILSSRYEGLPAVVIEAMAAGIPVIATNCCSSMPSLLGHGRFGRLVPTDDEAALALAIGKSLPTIDPAGGATHAARNACAAVADFYLRLFMRILTTKPVADLYIRMPGDAVAPQ